MAKQATFFASLPDGQSVKGAAADILEAPDCWVVRDYSAGLETWVGTAVEALATVKQWDADSAAAGLSVIRSVHWYPTTKIGRWVVAAITGAGK